MRVRKCVILAWEDRRKEKGEASEGELYSMSLRMGPPMDGPGKFRS